MKDIVIFGANDFGRLLKYYIDNDDPRSVVAFTMDKEFIEEDSFCGIPVVDFENVEKKYPQEKYELMIGIGNSKMNQIRETVFKRIKDKGYTVASFIHPNTSMHCTDIGEGNIILEKCMIYPFSKIGNGNLLWDHVLISHDCEVGDFNTFSSYADLCGYVKIKNNGYFGKHCIINDFVKIDNYTLVGAAAYAKKNTKAFEVVVPARSVILEHKKSTDLM